MISRLNLIATEHIKISCPPPLTKGLCRKKPVLKSKPYKNINFEWHTQAPDREGDVLSQPPVTKNIVSGLDDKDILFMPSPKHTVILSAGVAPPTTSFNNCTRSLPACLLVLTLFKIFLHFQLLLLKQTLTLIVFLSTSLNSSGKRNCKAISPQHLLVQKIIVLQSPSR